MDNMLVRNLTDITDMAIYLSMITSIIDRNINNRWVISCNKIVFCMVYIIIIVVVAAAVVVDRWVIALVITSYSVYGCIIVTVLVLVLRNIW